jgi:hypothetical protein
MKMKINLKQFRVREGEEVNLLKRPTNVAPYLGFLAHDAVVVSPTTQTVA